VSRPRSPPGVGYRPQIFFPNSLLLLTRLRFTPFGQGLPPSGQWREGFAIAGMNGDGHPDLALAVHLRGLIALLGDGMGGFRDSSQGRDFALGGKSAFSSTALRLVDWNGDGRPDILALGERPELMGGRLVHSSRGVSLYHNLYNFRQFPEKLIPLTILSAVEGTTLLSDKDRRDDRR
jgi:hypothetical protein